MKLAIATFACILVSAARGQTPTVPDRLELAVKSGLQHLDEQKQQDIVTYSRNNDPQNGSKCCPDTATGNFYTLYSNEPVNRFYNNYDTNNDPVITGMPAPGPNLNYQMVNPSSSGNYDKVVPQK